MPKVSLYCPHCHNQFQLQTVLPADVPETSRQSNGQISPLNKEALSDIFEVLQRVGAGRRIPASEFYAEYQRVVVQHVRRRKLSQYAFFLGLQRYGCTKWRSKYYRGYATPDELPTEPLGMDRKAAERRDAESYRQTVSRGGRPKPEEPDEPFVPPF